MDARVKRVRKHREKLVRELALTKEMLQGSIVKGSFKCGRPGCKCTRGEKHGPKYYLSYKVKGVTRNLYIPEQMLPYVKQCTKLYARFKRTGEKISDLNKQLLVLLKEQGSRR